MKIDANFRLLGVVVVLGFATLIVAAKGDAIGAFLEAAGALAIVSWGEKKEMRQPLAFVAFGMFLILITTLLKPA